MSASLSFDEFIAALPAERQAPMRQVWEWARTVVPAGYTEHIGPKYLEFRAGKDMYLGLASQKSYMSLHLVAVYVMPGLREQLMAAAPTLKMGKGCLNFKRPEDLPLAALAQVVGATPPADYVAQLQQARAAARPQG